MLRRGWGSATFGIVAALLLMQASTFTHHAQAVFGGTIVALTGGDDNALRRIAPSTGSSFVIKSFGTDTTSATSAFDVGPIGSTG